MPARWFPRIAWLACACLTLQAADRNEALEIPQLTLSDGRTLRNVSVVSYDATTDKVLIVADRKAMTLAVSLVAEPMRQQVRQAPASGATVTISAPPKSAPAATPPAAGGTSVAQAPSADPLAVAPRSPEAVRQQAHQVAALSHAQRYFRYEHQVGPSNVRVESVDFELAHVREVPGWTGRFETAGTAFVEYFDSSRFSYGRAKFPFVVQTEERPDAPIAVVLFERKS